MGTRLENSSLPFDIHFAESATQYLSNVVEAHGYRFRSTVVSGEHSRSKTSAIIALVLHVNAHHSLLLIIT